MTGQSHRRFRLSPDNHNHRSRRGTLASSIRLSLLLVCSLLLLITISTNNNGADCNQGPIKAKESGIGTLDIIRTRGYIGELYTIMSGDGYPLAIYHIINPLADQRTLYKYPVLIFHGLGGDSSQMVGHSKTDRPRRPVFGQIIYDPSDQNLPFLLSNNNFDVWLVDARGTNVNNHGTDVDLNVLEGFKYWNFSIDEQAEYDVPAIVNFILQQTQEEKLHYIGYSQSTAFMFAHLSMHPEFQNKLASFTAEAPVSYVAHITGLGLTLFTPVALMPDNMPFNYLPQLVSDTVGNTLREVCTKKLLFKTVCSPVAQSVTGVGGDTESTMFYSTILRGTSTKVFKHFLQLVQQRRFGKYDYGPAENLRRYGSVRPPDYPLHRITLPTIILARGGRDFLSRPQDQLRLMREISTKPYLDIWLPSYNHLDFLLGPNMLYDTHLPISRALLDITKQWLGATDGDVRPLLRVPKMLAGPKAKPVEVVWPGGSRDIQLQSYIVTNLVTGALGGVRPWAKLMPGNLVGQQSPADILERVGHRVDTMGTQVAQVQDMVLNNIL